MARVEVAKVPKSQKRDSKRELYATVCFYYPRYSLEDAQNLPARDIALLLKTARKLEAQRYYNLTQISAAPQTEKGKGVKQLSEHYKKEAN